MRQNQLSSRGPIGWLKSRTIWGILVDTVCGFLFSIGFFGEGEIGVKAKEKFEDWLKGHRKQTYGVVMDYYEGSVKEGKPMFKDKKFWILLLGLAVTIVPQLMEMVPQETLGYVILGAMLPVLMFLHQQFSLEKEEQKTEQVRQLVVARQIETRNLELARELRSGQPPSVSVGGGGVDTVIK